MENNKPAPVTLNRYPLNDALDCIAYYKERATILGISRTNLIKAYLVEKKDLLNTLGIPFSSIPATTYDYIRVYIGMENTGSDEDSIYKLFLTPVTDVTSTNKAGTDVILFGYVRDGDLEEMEYVYDFNTPCPNTCDKRSRLFQAGE